MKKRRRRLAAVFISLMLGVVSIQVPVIAGNSMDADSNVAGVDKSAAYSEDTAADEKSIGLDLIENGADTAAGSEDAAGIESDEVAAGEDAAGLESDEAAAGEDAAGLESDEAAAGEDAAGLESDETVVGAAESVSNPEPWNGFTWKLSVNGTCLTVTGSGEMPDATNAPWRAAGIRKAVTEIRTGNYITTIGKNAFSNFPNLKTVKIGLRFQRIGEKAFAGCTNLQTINNTSNKLSVIGTEAFSGCESLSEAFIPDTLRTVGARAFYSCGSIRRLNIPFGVTSIGNGAFSLDAGLCHVSIPESVKTVGKGVFARCDGLTSAVIDSYITGEGIFQDCSGLTEVTLGEHLYGIGINAFNKCISLRSINIPGNVYVIGDSAFEGCPELFNVNFSEGLHIICTKAFAGTNIKSVSFPSTIETIGEQVFASCESLEKVDFGKTKIQVIPLDAFANDIHLKNVNMGNQVRQIEQHAFIHCQELEQITFSEKLEKVGNGAFAYDYALKMVSLPDSVKSIEENAFYYCSNLEKASIGAGAKTLGNNAFAFCLNLTLVTVHRMDTEYKGKNIFRSAPVTLRGYKGSTTEAYAGQVGRPFEVIRGLATPVLRVCTLARTGVSLKWNAISGAINYTVFRSLGTGLPKKVVTTTAPEYLDTSAVSGTTYQYYIVADDGSMQSEESDTKKIFFVGAPKSVSNHNTLKGMQVTWTAVTNAAQYIISRKTDDGSYENLKTVDASQLSFVDETAVCGKIYQYAVAAVIPKPAGDSGSVTGRIRESRLYQRLTVPTIAAVKTPSAGTMVVSWGKLDHARGYQLLYTTDSTFKTGVTTVTIGGKDKLNITVTGLKSGKTYYVRVRCYQKVGSTYYYSGNSLKKSVKVK